MAEQNGVIKMRQVFNNEAGLWEALPEGCGVVVFSRFDGKMVAYGDACELLREQEILEASLSGARMLYGDQAFLVKKEDGILVCQRRRQEKPAPKKKAWW